MYNRGRAPNSRSASPINAQLIMCITKYYSLKHHPCINIFFFLYCFISLKQGKQLTVCTWVIFTRLYGTHFSIIFASLADKKSSFHCIFFQIGTHLRRILDPIMKTTYSHSESRIFFVTFPVPGGLRRTFNLRRRHIYTVHFDNTTTITLFCFEFPPFGGTRINNCTTQGKVTRKK